MRLLDRYRHREQTLEEDDVAVDAIERKVDTEEQRVLALETEARIIQRTLGGGDERSKPA